MADRSTRPARAVEQEPDFADDLRYWIKHDRRVALRLLDLIEAARRNPFTGLGKPEPLRHLGANVWSGRLTDEHRLVYRVVDDRIVVVAARYHYRR